MSQTPIFVLFSFSLVTAACTSDDPPPGGKEAAVIGTARNMRTGAVEDPEVALVWVNSSGSPDLAIGDSAPIEGSFPAAFRVRITETPPATTFNVAPDGSRMAVAYIFSARAGTDFSSEEAAGDGILGMDPDHLLVYLPEAPAVDSVVSTILRGTPSVGFHVYDVRHLTDADIAEREACEAGLGDPSIQQLFEACGGFSIFDDFIPTAADLDTNLEVDLVDSLEDLDFPNWT